MRKVEKKIYLKPIQKAESVFQHSDAHGCIQIRMNAGHKQSDAQNFLEKDTLLNVLS